MSEATEKTPILISRDEWETKWIVRVDGVDYSSAPREDWGRESLKVYQELEGCEVRLIKQKRTLRITEEDVTP